MIELVQIQDGIWRTTTDGWRFYVRAASLPSALCKAAIMLHRFTKLANT